MAPRVEPGDFMNELTSDRSYDLSSSAILYVSLMTSLLLMSFIILCMKLAWIDYPIYGDISNESSAEEFDDFSLNELTFWYMMVLLVMLLVWLFLFCCLRLIGLGQKTRDAQQPRRMYGERGARAGSPSPPPTVFVTPHNIPPPPKYEMMAPPSYEEVVGVHYPNYSPATSDSNQVATSGQPITQPLTVSVAQLATSCHNITETNQHASPTTSGSSEQARTTTVAAASS
ncbi:hypothetical protein EVAR_63462_1 [Eumeta japonica]|uniref:Uncharacterized protein n=1 Tax=Eumeta variegata TaxID=151549 RepID=A0A4C1Y9C5_EUMVA|nr:hypothetical protein EVAR_63462_1 [Eumeta japonica]